MPRLGGEGVIRALRGLWPGLPVAVISGDLDVGDAEALRRRSRGHGPLVLFGQSLAAEDLAAIVRAMLAAAAAPGAPRMAPGSPGPNDTSSRSAGSATILSGYGRAAA